MKKFISILMVSIMVLTLFTFVGCGKEDEPTPTPTLKLGFGVVTAEVKAGNATPADGDTAAKNGTAQAASTAAAVLVDNDGKVVKAFIDCAQNKVQYTPDGKAVANTTFKTKYETGSEYGMVAHGGAAKEWFEQADAFCALIVGKTAAEITALVAEDGKGTSDVISAGCTIAISEFVTATVEAINSAVPTNATKNDTLKLGVSTFQTLKDATPANEETGTAAKAGSNKVTTNFFAAAVNAEGKVVAAISDCVEISYTFDVNGQSTFDATKEILSKKEQGDSYGMKQYAGSAKEWYEQAAAFDAACIGKTASEIAGLMGADSKGTADLQAAGCTIAIDGFVKAAAKIG